MNEVIGLNLGTSVGVAISPFPIIGLLLVLFSATPIVNGLAYVLGVTVGTAIPVVLGMVSPVRVSATDSDNGGNLFQLAFGLLFWWLAYRSWQGRPDEGEPAQSPAWMARLNSASALQAAGIGLLLSLLNLKNLPLNFGAGSVIATGELTGSQQLLALAAFLIVATASVTLPLVAFMVAREHVEPVLVRLKDWLVVNSSTIMAVMFALLGAQSLGLGIASS